MGTSGGGGSDGQGQLLAHIYDMLSRQGGGQGSGGGANAGNSGGGGSGGGSGASSGSVPLPELLQLVLAQMKQSGGNAGGGASGSGGTSGPDASATTIPIAKVLELALGGSGSGAAGGGSTSTGGGAGGGGSNLQQLSQELTVTLKKLRNILQETHSLAERIESALSQAQSGGHPGGGQGSN